MKLSDRLLNAFNNWFTSKGGVFQTTLVTLIIVILELANRRLDTHGFWLLYWLTIYSAVTQPALAHSGAVSSARLEVLEHQIYERELELQAKLDSINTKLEALQNGSH